MYVMTAQRNALDMYSSVYGQAECFTKHQNYNNGKLGSIFKHSVFSKRSIVYIH